MPTTNQPLVPDAPVRTIAIIQQVNDGYRRDSLESLELVRERLNQMHAQPELLEPRNLGFLTLQLELAVMRVKNHLKTAQLLNHLATDYGICLPPCAPGAEQ